MRVRGERHGARTASEPTRPDPGPLSELTRGHDRGRIVRDALVRPGIEPLRKRRGHGDQPGGGDAGWNVRGASPGPEVVARSRSARAVSRIRGRAWRDHRGGPQGAPATR